jgi:hypothetical protein
MAEQQPSPSADSSAVSAQLHEIAQLLRGTHHLGAEAQQALAQLADELGNLLDPALPPPPEAAPLVESTAHVVQALHGEQSSAPSPAARYRLQQLAAELDARAPRVAAFARRLLEALGNIGI